MTFEKRTCNIRTDCFQCSKYHWFKHLKVFCSLNLSKGIIHVEKRIIIVFMDAFKLSRICCKEQRFFSDMF